MERSANNSPSFIKNEFAALPMVVKSIIVIGGATLVFFAGRAIVKGVRAALDSKEGRKEGNAWGNLLNSSDADSTKPTLSLAEMRSIANKLENAMDGYGTRDADIIAMFKRVKTVGDLAGINKEFGIRTIEAGYGVGWLSPTTKGTLSQMLQEEADSSTITAINNHLKSQGIEVLM
tara:strand:+ start:1262 stop:1789 length:528 start_codon:yes stop_codon:yes gene_type:complete